MYVHVAGRDYILIPYLQEIFWVIGFYLRESLATKNKARNK